MEELKRRTLVVRIFPNSQSCLLRALAVEIHENWIEATRYLNMEGGNEEREITHGRHSLSLNPWMGRARAQSPPLPCTPSG